MIYQHYSTMAKLLPQTFQFRIFLVLHYLTSYLMLLLNLFVSSYLLLLHCWHEFSSTLERLVVDKACSIHALFHLKLSTPRFLFFPRFGILSMAYVRVFPLRHEVLKNLYHDCFGWLKIGYEEMAAVLKIGMIWESSVISLFTCSIYRLFLKITS